MFCSKCGVTNDEDAVFCKECGSKLNPNNSQVVISKNTEVKGFTKVIGWISAFIFPPLGLVVGLYLLYHNANDNDSWFIFGIAFVICFLVILSILLSIEGNLSYISDLVPQMRVY